MITNIVLKIVNSICTLVQKILCIFLIWIIGMMDIENFRPTIDYFEKHVIGSQNLETIMVFFGHMGYAISIALFALMFIFLWFSGFRDMKDTPATLIARQVLVIFAIAAAPTYLSYASEFVDTLYANSLSVIGSPSINGLAMSDIKLIFRYVPDEIGGSQTTMVQDAVNVLNASSTDEMVGFAALSSIEPILASCGVLPIVEAVLAIFTIIIRCILLFAVLYNLVKLLVELVRRYITFCVLYMTFPATCASLASASTSQIFLSYMKSYFVELLVLLLTHIWITLSIFLLFLVPTDIVGSFILISFINIGVKMEQWLKEHGFTISSTGGDLLRTTVQSGADLARVTASLGNKSGNVFQNIGAATGRKEFGGIGNVLKGKPLSSQGILDGMQNSVMGQMANTSFGKKARQNGMFKRSNNDTFGMMNDCFRSGGKTDMDTFGKTFNSLTEDEQADYLNSFKENILGVNGYDEDGKKQGISDFEKSMNLNIDPEKDIKDLAYDSKNGRINGTLSTPIGDRDFSIGTNNLDGTGIKFKDTTGNDMYMNFGKNNQPKKNISDIPLSDIVGDNNAFSQNALKNTPLSTIAGFTEDELNDSFSRFAGGSGNINMSDFTYSCDNGNATIRDNAGNFVLGHAAGGQTVYSSDAPNSIFSSADTLQKYFNNNENLFSENGMSNLKVDSMQSNYAKVTYDDTEGKRQTVKFMKADHALGDIKRYQPVFDNVGFFQKFK